MTSSPYVVAKGSLPTFARNKPYGQNMSSSIVAHFTIFWVTILRIIVAKVLKFPFAESVILCWTVVFFHMRHLSSLF